MMVFVALIATSCQKDGAGDATVSFFIGTPEIATRAYSDGYTAAANDLVYAVYENENGALTKLNLDGTASFGGDLKTQIQLQLKTGKTYSIVFWAAADKAPYSVSFDQTGATMVADYSNVVSNDENLDAFFKCHTFTVSGDQTESVELRRPFAQLNIGASDYTIAATAGYAPVESKVVVKSWNTLNLVDGSVTGDATVTFDYAAIDTNEVFPVAGNKYIAMNYLLVPTNKETVEVEFFYAEANQANAESRKVGSVPVQRNYRTNIYGNLFTSSVEINVEIVPEYEKPDYNVFDFPANKAQMVANIQAAVANGETEVVINALNKNIGDLNGAFTTQLVPAGVTVKVCNAVVDGRSYGNKLDGTVIFENCTFNNPDGAYSIHFDGGNGDVRFVNCELYGWNSFGAIGSVSFADCKLLGNGTYAFIRAYTTINVGNLAVDYTNANTTDEWPEGVEQITYDANGNEVTNKIM